MRIGAGSNGSYDDDIRRAESCGESLEDRAHRAAILAAGQERDRLRRGLLLLQLRHEQLLRFFPGDGLVLSRAARARQLQRRLNAIGMVERLHARLAAGARAAHADRVLGVALDLLRLDGLDALLLAVDRADRFALHHAHGDAAARRALLAERANPAFFSRHELVFGDEQRNQLLRLAASVEDEAGRAGDAAGFEEISSFHVDFIYDTPGNRRSPVFPGGSRCTCPSSS